MVLLSNIYQYTCKELFMMDFNLERCKENFYVSFFLLVSAEDQDFDYLQNSHDNLAQAIEMPLEITVI